MSTASQETDRVGQPGAEGCKTTAVGEFPNDSESSDEYENFSELERTPERGGGKQETHTSNQAMTTRPRGRSVFYIDADDSQKNNSCGKLTKNAGLLSLKVNSTTRKVRSFEDSAKDMYDHADREMRIVKLVDSTVEGWVYVTRSWIKKENISKRNPGRTKGLPSFQRKQTLCDEIQVNNSDPSRKDNKILSNKTNLFRANTERREFRIADKRNSCTVVGKRKLRTNTESIATELPLYDYKFPANENDAKTQAKTKEMKIACRNNAQVAQKLQARNQIKPQNSDYNLDQEEYVEMSSNHKPLEKDGAELQHCNSSKVDEPHQGHLDERSAQYYNSEVSGVADSKREKDRSLAASNENYSTIKKCVDHTFRPFPMPRQQSIKPQPKPRTRISVLQRNKKQNSKSNSPLHKTEQESGNNSEPVALKPSLSPETSENEKKEPKENISRSRPSNMKPIPSPRPKIPIARAPVSTNSSNSVSKNDPLSSYYLDILPDSKTKDVLSDSENTFSSSPPPRPPKTHLIKTQTSFYPKHATLKPTHTSRNSGLKDENGYLLPVDEHLLPEKPNKLFVCQRSPPPLPHKPSTKKGNSTISPTGSKAKTFAPGGNRPLKPQLPSEPSTIPRASPSFLRSEELKTSGFKNTQYGMKLAQGPWYACRDITRESFIDDCPLWPYEYVEEWVPPLKTSKSTTENLSLSKSDSLKTQRESPSTCNEMTIPEQKSEGPSIMTDAYEVMGLPLSIFVKENAGACNQNSDQYEEVKFSSGPSGKGSALYYEDIDLNIVTGRKSRSYQY